MDELREDELNHGELIHMKARQDPLWAIAWALLQVADKIDDVALNLADLSGSLEVEVKGKLDVNTE